MRLLKKQNEGNRPNIIYSKAIWSRAQELSGCHPMQNERISRPRNEDCLVLCLNVVRVWDQGSPVLVTKVYPLSIMIHLLLMPHGFQRRAWHNTSFNLLCQKRTLPDWKGWQCWRSFTFTPIIFHMIGVHTPDYGIWKRLRLRTRRALLQISY